MNHNFYGYKKLQDLERNYPLNFLEEIANIAHTHDHTLPRTFTLSPKVGMHTINRFLRDLKYDAIICTINILPNSNWEITIPRPYYFA